MATVANDPGWRCFYPNCVQWNPWGETRCAINHCYGFNRGKDISAGSLVLTELVGVRGQIQFVVVLIEEDVKHKETNVMRKAKVMHLRKTRVGDETEILDVGMATQVCFGQVIGIIPVPTSTTEILHSLEQITFPLGTMPNDVIRV